MRLRQNVAMAMMLGAVLVLLAGTGAAQDVLLPQQSAVKAKELVQRSIQAMGGQAYLDIREFYRVGRLAQFSSAGDLAGYAKFFDYTKLPDKNRTEYGERRNIITLYTAAEGWEMDRAGVQQSSVESIERYRENLRKDIDHLFRYRLNQEGMIFRYEGSDIIDLRPVEWVEVVDPDRLTTRIAFDNATHLPMRVTYIWRDPTTRQRIEELEFLSNWHAVQGVQTAMQVARERNGIKVYQAFFTEYQFNLGLADALFTRASLDEAFAKFNKKDKDKKEKGKGGEKKKN